MSEIDEFRSALFDAIRSNADLRLSRDYSAFTSRPLVNEARELLYFYRDWTPPLAERTDSLPVLDVFAPQAFELKPTDEMRLGGEDRIDIRRPWDCELWTREILHLCLYVDALVTRST